jgi:hypothetical protein
MGHVFACGQCVWPACEVVGDGCLVVAAALQDEHRFVERGGEPGRVVVAEIKPIGGRAEREVARRCGGGEIGIVDASRFLGECIDDGLRGCFGRRVERGEVADLSVDRGYPLDGRKPARTAPTKR